MSNQIRTRIAPSPTGNLHLGTARAALFNYLFAKKHDGKFILRIEDTDLERSDPRFEKDILEGLRWLGITWDEGPINPTQPPLKIRGGKEGLYIGKFGPYRQSERIETYKKYLQKLLDENKAYYCFCAESELEKERESQKTVGAPPKYSGKCANLGAQELKDLKKQGKKSVIRFRIPKNRKVKFKDLIRGDLEFDSNLIGDIVIAKDLNTPLYNFAVVIDDYLMQISHIIRGEDHISNTPKQILMQEALGFPTLEFAHLPLILGPDRTKLSKRHGATSLNEYKKTGYLPEAMLNFMAFLGWNPKTKKEVFSKEELVAEFALTGVGKSGAIFNIERLDWINGLYVRRMGIDKLTELCVPYLVEAGYIQKIPNSKFQIPNKFQIQNYKMIKTDKKISFKDLEKVIALEQERIKKLSEIPKVLDFYFKKDIEYEPDLLIWKKTDKNKIRKNLEILQKFLESLPEKDFEKKNLEKKIKNLIAKEKMGVGEALWPVRVALSGKQGSPGPFEIIEVLKKERTLDRIRGAILKLSKNIP
ncbi:MAG: glutamate--tRNA ligase [Patescibacteria group bacterium]